MEAIDLIMKIWNIQEQYKADVEKVLSCTAPERIEEELADFMQHPSDDDFDSALDAWFSANFRHLQFSDPKPSV